MKSVRSVAVGNVCVGARGSGGGGIAGGKVGVEGEDGRSWEENVR